MPRGRKWVGDERGYSSQRNRARARLIIGAIMKGNMFAEAGVECSLRNSFRASANGCGSPMRATLFGPFRS